MEKLKLDIMVENDDELIELMRKEYANCPQAIRYCNELGIPPEKIDENIVKIFDFVSDINYCKKFGL